MSQPTQKQGAVVRIDPHFTVLGKRLHQEARKGSIAFNKFLASPEFKRRFDALEPSYWRRVMKLVADAEALMLDLDRLPPLGKPLPYRGASKLTNRYNARWKQPAELARLKAAFLKAGPGEGQAERAARILGVTKGTAVLAYRRHVLNAATQGSDQKAA